jgi:hypothetical protein
VVQRRVFGWLHHLAPLKIDFQQRSDFFVFCMKNKDLVDAVLGGRGLALADYELPNLHVME